MNLMPLSRSAAVSIRSLQESELDDADRIFRRAFGTFLGLPDPMAFMNGAELIRARWRTEPTAFLAAHLDGMLAGSCYATNWGSVGFFGPLTIRPELWDHGVGQRLLEAIMALFRDWGTRHLGLFTFPHSPMHIGLYQKYGFWPRSLTAIMAKRLETAPYEAHASLLSELPEDTRRDAVNACFELSDSVHAGLDLRGEIASVLDQGIGDILLVHQGSRLEAFAICHCGSGSEAECGSCYVKFALCRRGQQADANFKRLLAACQQFAGARSADRLIAGVSTARHAAYRTMLASGFKPQILGIAMHQPNEPGYSREEIYAIDDWR